MGCTGFHHPDQTGKSPLSYVKDKSDPVQFGIRNSLLNLDGKIRQLNSLTPQFEIYPPENLTFKGGGPKGIAYVGVIQALERTGKLSGIKRIAGTSAGAITAILIALGYNSQEIRKILTETNLKSFLDHHVHLSGLAKAMKNSLLDLLNPLQLLKKPFKTIHRLTGLCEGKVFLNWIENLIFEKTQIRNCTFGELAALRHRHPEKYKHIHVFATDISGQKIVRISSEDPKYSNIIIAGAIRASMSIPGVFKPYILREKTESGIILRPDLGTLVDGGLLKNSPSDAFDFLQYQTNTPLSESQRMIKTFNSRTLAFNLIAPPKKEGAVIDRKDIKTINKLLISIIKIYLDAEELSKQLDEGEQLRTINISNLGVSTLAFNLPAEKQDELIQSGQNASLEFFKTQERHAREKHLAFIELARNREALAPPSTPISSSTTSPLIGSSATSSSSTERSHCTVQ